MYFGMVPAMGVCDCDFTAALSAVVFVFCEMYFVSNFLFCASDCVLSFVVMIVIVNCEL